MSTTIQIRAKEIRVTYAVSKVKEEDGTISCFIPSLKIAYCAGTEEEIISKSRYLILSFVKFYERNGATNIQELFTDLKKMGFKTRQMDLLLFRALKRNQFPKNAKFSNDSSPVIPGSQVEKLDLRSVLA